VSSGLGGVGKVCDLALLLFFFIGDAFKKLDRPFDSFLCREASEDIEPVFEAGLLISGSEGGSAISAGSLAASCLGAGNVCDLGMDLRMGEALKKLERPLLFCREANEAIDPDRDAFSSSDAGAVVGGFGGGPGGRRGFRAGCFGFMLKNPPVLLLLGTAL
jgi:hypothetical protein